MKKFLWAHIIIEGIGGLILYLYPELLYFQGTAYPESFPIIKLYSLLACCFALAYLFINLSVREHSKLFLQLYLLAMGFQLFVTFQCYGMVNSAYLGHKGAYFTHLAVFIILTIGYFLHRFDKVE